MTNALAYCTVDWQNALLKNPLTTETNGSLANMLTQRKKRGGKKERKKEEMVGKKRKMVATFES